MGSTQRSKVRYSPQEERLLLLLPDDGSLVSSAVLVNKLYGANRPFSAESSVTSTMAGLIRKLDHNGDKYMITKTPPRGPYPTEYAKVKRPKR